MKINLTQQETMTLLACAYNQLDDLNELKSKNKLSIGWKIMFDDFNSAIKKLNKQYKHQLKTVEQDTKAKQLQEVNR
jgi:uncharacterized protein YecT (DUF1311 family)